MDLQIFADHLDQLPVFPHFALCHMIVCLLNIRIDLGTGKWCKYFLKTSYFNYNRATIYLHTYFLFTR